MRYCDNPSVWQFPRSYRCLLAAAAILMFFAPQPASAERIVLPLDGTWAVADSVGAEEIPARFDHAVAVPGLTNQAQPHFADVDHYETHEYLFTMTNDGVLPKSEMIKGLGRTRQKRNYFWYERTFTAPAKRQSAVLVVNKAQFGTAVWLNGKKLGEYLGCFTASRYDATAAMNWSGENRVLIRIGAHLGVMPKWALVGTDGEKGPWTPGIYDSVSLIFADYPAIETVQIAPQIRTSTILVETRLRNPGPAITAEIVQRVKTWKGGQAVGEPVSQRVELAAGAEKTIRQTVPVPNATLWSPDNPFLYVLDTSTGGDSAATRFGMREFRCDTASRRAWLNGKIIYLRGSSITLHRFFGDPKCGGLPWDEAWVRRFLVEIPRQMHWNCFRLCIGLPPQRWLDIADEAGLILQYEFPIWDDREPLRHKQWKESDVIEQIRQYVRDAWNHPSVCIWDASNETTWDFLRTKAIPAVRGMDLSNRPWENGYNAPQGPDDPQEEHPYMFIGHMFGKPPYFKMADLEKMNGMGRPGKPHGEHALLINEYDWLWLHRDGTPAVLSKPVYDHLLGPNATSAQRFSLCAYLLGGLSEYWRAHRNYAAVMYLAYLDADLPHCFTCDNLVDVERLKLEPQFADYMSEAFKPLGVYINFWQPELAAGAARTYRVMMVNDTYEPAKGKLELAWEEGGGGKAEGGRKAWQFELPALGQASYDLPLTTPDKPGKYVLKARAFWDGKPFSPTLSRRKVTVKAGS
jgi:beta-galactosidase